MADPGTWAAIGLAVSAVGTGAAVYGQRQAARTTEQFARFNAMVEANNARLNHRMMLAQAESQRRALEAEAAMQSNNAQMLRQMANAQAGADRENIRRTREDHMRFQAIQRAKVASSGILEEGSPLEVLADTAGLMELTLQDLHYESDLNRRSLLWQADVTQAGAGATLFQARATGLDVAAANAGLRQGLRQADITQRAGLAQASGMRRDSVATLLTGIGGAGMSYAGARGFTPS